MNRCQLLLVLVLGSVVGLPATAPGAPRYVRSGGNPVSANTACTQEVLFGRLVVTDASTGAFVLQGDEREFHAPRDVDVSAFDGTLVRIDFDGTCSVRTILHAERLEGSTIEA